MPLVEHTAGGIRAGTTSGVCASGSGDVDVHDEGRVTIKVTRPSYAQSAT
jgi:hypothetical protein